MKNYFLLFFLFVGVVLAAQDTPLTKPEYVVIAADQIITENQLSEYGSQGRVKSMQKGVSEEEFKHLQEQYGSEISDRQFIILIGLYSDAELDSLSKVQAGEPKVADTPKDNGFILHTGDEAADFTVDMTDGSTLRLSDLKGKVVLLDFWATWCAPCIMEFYDVHNQVLVPMKDSNLVFLPVSIGESKKTVLKKLAGLQAKGLEINSGIDTEKEIWDLYATGSIPKSLVIDKNGIIRYSSVGNSDETIAKLIEVIGQLL